MLVCLKKGWLSCEFRICTCRPHRDEIRCLFLSSSSWKSGRNHWLACLKIHLQTLMTQYYKPRISRIWFLIENANAVSTTMVGENNIPERAHNLNSLRGALTRDKCSRSTIFVLRVRIESIISYIDDLYDGGVAGVDSREISPGLTVAEAERSSCEFSEHSSVHFRIVFSKFHNFIFS